MSARSKTERLRTHHSSDSLLVDLCQGNRSVDGDAASGLATKRQQSCSRPTCADTHLLTEHNVGLLAVQPNPNRLELNLQQPSLTVSSAKQSQLGSGRARAKPHFVTSSIIFAIQEAAVSYSHQAVWRRDEPEPDLRSAGTQVSLRTSKDAPDNSPSPPQ